MSETVTVTPPKAKPEPLTSPDSANQLWTALAIVFCVGTLGIALIIAGCLTGQWAILGVPIGTVLGILGTALNAPTGIGNVLAAARGGSSPVPPGEFSATVTSSRTPS